MNSDIIANEIRLGILLKPDAVAESNLFSAKQFYDSLLSLNSFLLSDRSTSNKFLLSNSISAHEGAIRQLSERCLSEISFSYPISNKSKIIHAVSKILIEISNSNVTYSISEIIERFISFFGFKIESCHNFFFDVNDCLTIYPVISQNDTLLFNSIRLYLVNKKCRIYFLSGRQSITAIEYIKTFVRYFFKYKQGEKHRLENYIHSLDEFETKYFSGKLL